MTPISIRLTKEIIAYLFFVRFRKMMNVIDAYHIICKVKPFRKGLSNSFRGVKRMVCLQLREMGMSKHPVELRKLELYKTYVVRTLFLELVKENSQKEDTIILLYKQINQ